MIISHSERILNEISQVFKSSDFSKVNDLIDIITTSDKIILAGAGRVGYATKGFAMRLKHMGFNSYMIGDSNVPAIGKSDLFIVSSGSGETQTIYDLVCIAKNQGSKIVLITGNSYSRMGKLADIIIKLNAPSKLNSVHNFTSVQPMTSLNEQSLFIFFDSLTLEIMRLTGETHESMWARHSRLE